MKYKSPKAWKISKFSDVAKVVTGSTPLTSHPEYYGDFIPFIGPSELGYSVPITTSTKNLSELGSKKARILPKDSVLVCCIGATIGKVGFAGTELVTNQQMNSLVFDESKVFPRYAFYYCQTIEKLIRHQGSSTTLPILPKGRFQELEIPLPPLEEQKRIAAILDNADRIRRKRQEAIRLTEELGRSIFLDMFGDPVKNPKGWEKVTLGSQVLDLKYGTNLKCHDTKQDEDFPVLRIPNIIGEQISWSDLKFATIPEKEKEQFLLQKEDLLFVRSNGNPEYIGRCALFEDSRPNVSYASYLIRGRLKTTSQFEAAFIRDIISFPTYRFVVIKQARTTAGNYNINTQGLKSLPLIKPDLEKQKQYLEFKKNIRSHINSQIQHLSESENLFNSLLQRAFRGEL